MGCTVSMALASCLQQSHLDRWARLAGSYLRLPFGLRAGTDKMTRITGQPDCAQKVVVTVMGEQGFTLGGRQFVVGQLC